jgi:hypothetical protein
VTSGSRQPTIRPEAAEGGVIHLRRGRDGEGHRIRRAWRNLADLPSMLGRLIETNSRISASIVGELLAEMPHDNAD